jgi:hypothetical protein
MSKNIVLLSDGTGNSSASPFKTNVWRLFQILDLQDPTEQIAFYDDGVGTSSFRLFAALGSIFGFGLKRNVIALYSFCCRNYKPGDRIYCFGFSRGAFTIRVVAGMIASQGLVQYQDSDAELARYATDAYRAYRRGYTGGMFGILRYVRDGLIAGWRMLCDQPLKGPMAEVDSVHFVGVWDTVDAYGGPIQEMTRAIDYWIWPLSMPNRFMSAKILRACHAISLEDERDAFTPVIWDERYVRARPAGSTKYQLFDVNYDPRTSKEAREKEPLPHLRDEKLPEIDRQRISQVWFTGVHADIGGGYPQNGLSFVTLDWMMDRATPYGLKFLDEQRKLLIDPQIDITDKLNDSRKGLASFYRYKPRNLRDLYRDPPYKPSICADMRAIWRLLWKIDDPQAEIRADLSPELAKKFPPDVRMPPPALPIIHATVFDRIKEGTDRYAPVVLPAAKAYRYTDAKDAILSGPHPADPEDRPAIQDDVWNWIWLRRIAYFLTIYAAAFVAFIPFFVIYLPRFGYDTVIGTLVKPLVNAAASFLPSFLSPWFVAFRDSPGFTLIGAIAVGGLMWWGGSLQQAIRDASRVAWRKRNTEQKSEQTSEQKPKEKAKPKPKGWGAGVYQLRRTGIYNGFFYVVSHWILPTAIMWWLFWWLAFGTANTLGLFCKPTGHAVDVTATAIGGRKSVGYDEAFHTNELCHPLSLKVAQDETYEISLDIPENDPWLDASIKASPEGFFLGSWRQLGGVPFKRLIWSYWFKPIIRVGSTGLEEHLPDFKEDPANSRHWTAQFVARSDGEVFIYVNDTSIFAPWLIDVFYKNNQGSAVVAMQRIDKP